MQVRPFLLHDRPGGFLGSYHFASMPVSTTGPAANADFFSLRWTSATALLVVLNASVQLVQSTTSTAGVPTFGLFVARSFTASDTGGTAIALTGSAFKKRGAYPTTLVGDARFGDGAALTPGTRTLDASAFVVSRCALAAGSVSPVGDVPELRSDPLILAQNEGLVLRNIVAQTAGITALQVKLEWIELSAGAL